MAKWLVDVKGDVNSESWEVAIVREDNVHGRRSWGWFDQNKLLVSHNGGPCHWPLAPGLGPTMNEVAEKYCDALNGAPAHEAEPE